MADHDDTGNYALAITDESIQAQTYIDIGNYGFTITKTSPDDFQFVDIGNYGFTISYPDIGVEVFNSGVPGFVSAQVIINSINQSEFISGRIQVTREDNAAARFSLVLNQDPDAVIPIKPASLINTIVSISFGAADMSGQVLDSIPIFTGIIKRVNFNEDHQALNISGYDYSGIHQTRGEYISTNITDVHTGSINANNAGTLSTGHSPIWGVEWVGNDSVIDGSDYFVSTKDGGIIIPISSRILQFPGSFNYTYANNFSTMKDIIQSVLNQKSWNILEDRVTIEDYTSTSAHPVLSLSNESVIDTTRKFLELSGSKVEGNLYPNLRVYSEVQNWLSSSNILTVDESIIFENSLNFTIDFDNLINEQTTRSVQKVNAEIVIGSGETIAEYSGSKTDTDPRTVQADVVYWNNFDTTTQYVVQEHRIRKQGLNSISFTSTGSFDTALVPFDTYTKTITGADWSFSTDGDDYVIQLKHNIVMLEGGGVQYWAIPSFNYTLTVLGTKIKYGTGTTEAVKVVTAQRPVNGITATMAGDVYENPYIETDTHCRNICDAVLLEHGNPYTAQFEIPVFEGRTAQIGDRIDIERDSNIIFSGIIKRLQYYLNLADGENRIVVNTRGVGRGI